LRGKIPPFYISIENHDVALHNCLVDTGATNNIMPVAGMILGAKFRSWANFPWIFQKQDSLF
jgi:hypothetical protein